MLSIMIFDAVAVGYYYLPKDIKDTVLKVAKNALERLLISKYAKDRTISSLIGLALPKIRTLSGASGILVEEVSRKLSSDLGQSLIKEVVIGEMRRRIKMKYPELIKRIKG